IYEESDAVLEVDRRPAVRVIGLAVEHQRDTPVGLPAVEREEELLGQLGLFYEVGDEARVDVLREVEDEVAGAVDQIGGRLSGGEQGKGAEKRQCDEK
ncbi:MAG TPA: hypothetical protein P5077_14415, partial [bacterium]|nr:hypothetical protein [bacterium]